MYKFVSCLVCGKSVKSPKKYCPPCRLIALSRRVRTHGKSATKIYSAWHDIKLKNKNNGTPMDPSWLKFENFLRDVGECPAGHSLSRIDKSVGYFKDNIRWILVSPLASRKDLDEAIRLVLLKMDRECFSITKTARVIGLVFTRFYNFLNGMNIRQEHLDTINKWLNEKGLYEKDIDIGM